MKTDLQKFQDFFNELNIVYSICTGSIGNKYINISDIHLTDNYGASLYIYFNNDETFYKFDTWGE